MPKDLLMLFEEIDKINDISIDYIAQQINENRTRTLYKRHESEAQATVSLECVAKYFDLSLKTGECYRICTALKLQNRNNTNCNNCFLEAFKLLEAEQIKIKFKKGSR